MDALHKFAGVSEAQRSDAASPPPPAAAVPASASALSIPPPVPPKDDARSIKSSKSSRRASIPLNRRKSQKSIRSGISANSSIRSKNRLPTDSRGNIPPTPKIPKSERNQYGDLAPQAVTGGPGSTHSSRRRAEGQASSTFEGEGEDGEGEGEGGEDESDFEWGPQHPCFPHPNPHCEPDTREAQETRVIRVKRDYLIAGDLYPQYANLYPEILDPLVTDDEFRIVIGRVNEIMEQAFSPDTVRAWVDAILGIATGYFWEDLGFTGVRSGEKEMEGYIYQWNQEREKEGRDVRLVQPRTTGFMTLDFVVPDPGIDIAVEENSDNAVAGDGGGDGEGEGGGGADATLIGTDSTPTAATSTATPAAPALSSERT